MKFIIFLAIIGITGQACQKYLDKRDIHWRGRILPGTLIGFVLFGLSYALEMGDYIAVYFSIEPINYIVLLFAIIFISIMNVIPWLKKRDLEFSSPDNISAKERVDLSHKKKKN